MTAHLARQGCRTCLVAGSSLAISNVSERWDGVVAAAGTMAVTMVEVGFDGAVAVQRLRAGLGPDRRPDALFALDHQTALWAFGLLGEMGLQASRDVAFASFDETEWMRLVSPPVSTVRQPVQAMAEAAWALLVRRIAGDHAVPDRTRLACSLEIRGSSLRPTGPPVSTAA